MRTGTRTATAPAPARLHADRRRGREGPLVSGPRLRAGTAGRRGRTGRAVHQGRVLQGRRQELPRLYQEVRSTPQVERERQSLADAGTNKSLGSATWRNYSIDVRTPFAEVDALKVSVGFTNGTGKGKQIRVLGGRGRGDADPRSGRLRRAGETRHRKEPAGPRSVW